jgi:predicted dehydrogenase
MGRRHARVLRSLDQRFEVVGAYDPRVDASTPEGFSRLTTDHEAVDRAEVIVVATPVETHARLASLALSLGKHVLVEKPLCATGAEAHALAAACRLGAKLFVGHSERFNPVVRALARLVRGEEIVHMDFRRTGLGRPGSGRALLNFGVHDFDLASYLGGSEITLLGASGPSPARRSEDFAHVVFSSAHGAVGHLYVDATSRIRERSMVVSTSRWTYEGDLLGHRLVRTARGSSACSDVPLPLDEPLAAQALALADAIDGKSGRDLATGLDGARAVEVAMRAETLLSTQAAGEPRAQGVPGG